MKVATVEYTGQVRNQTHRGPSGERYQFGGSKMVDVREMDDARHFESQPNFEVEFTARGRLLDLVSSEAEDLEAAIEDIDYNVKRSLASSLGLENDGRKESVLEQALVDQAEALKQQMENQP